MAVLPPGHPLEGSAGIELARLRDEHFALIKKDTLPYSLCVQACREAGFTPQVLFNSHNLDAVLDMVTKGGCVALLFERHAASPRPFTAVPIVPELRTTLYLAYLRDVPLSRPARHFIDCCMAQGGVPAPEK